MDNTMQEAITHRINEVKALATDIEPTHKGAAYTLGLAILLAATHDDEGEIQDIRIAQELLTELGQVAKTSLPLGGRHNRNLISAVTTRSLQTLENASYSEQRIQLAINNQIDEFAELLGDQFENLPDISKRAKEILWLRTLDDSFKYQNNHVTPSTVDLQEAKTLDVDHTVEPIAQGCSHLSISGEQAQQVIESFASDIRGLAPGDAQEVIEKAVKMYHASGRGLSKDRERGKTKIPGRLLRVDILSTGYFLVFEPRLDKRGKIKEPKVWTLTKIRRLQS